MRLVAIAKIAQIFGIGHIGFGDQRQHLHRVIREQTEKPHDLMGLSQVNAGRAGFLPNKGHRIEAQGAHAVIDMRAQDRHKGQQHFGVREIKIDLIMREGAPQMLDPVCGLHPPQQIMRARAHDGGEIGGRVRLEIEFIIRRMALQVIGKPLRAGRAVVEHQIRHQGEPLCDPLHIRPIAQCRVHREIIGHRETVIGGEGEIGQDMQAGERISQLGLREIAQQIQGFMRARPQSYCHR